MSTLLPPYLPNRSIKYHRHGPKLGPSDRLSSARIRASRNGPCTHWLDNAQETRHTVSLRPDQVDPLKRVSTGADQNSLLWMETLGVKNGFLLNMYGGDH